MFMSNQIKSNHRLEHCICFRFSIFASQSLTYHCILNLKVIMGKEYYFIIKLMGLKTLKKQIKED